MVGGPQQYCLLVQPLQIHQNNTLSLSDCTLNSVWWHSDADDVDADDLEVEAEDEGSDVDDMGDPFDSASD